VAAELGIPYRCAEDGLLLADERVDAAFARCDTTRPLLPALATACRQAALPAQLASALLAWAAPFADLGRLREALARRRQAHRRLVRDDAPLTLATAHGTKGLEWDHVACVGHDEGVFPSGRALAEADDPQRVLEEERRLAYVAWTRARVTLTIVYDPGAPSVFVREAFDVDELAAA
jgi:ATP-dependent exoDNAse (exonuclease V) beta subunit